MPQSMIIPATWLVEAGVQNFRPALTQCAFRCDTANELIALADIEVPLRRTGYPRDANGNPFGENGFDHDRMVRLLTGISDCVSLPAIHVEIAGPGERRYWVRGGMHRYHASRTLGFTHIPAEIVERID